MKRLAVFFLLCVVTATSGRADDSLVDASKNAKSKRKKSTTKVITNADVKKSKGTLIDTKASQVPIAPAEPGLVERYEAAKQIKTINDAKIAVLEKDVATFEKELAAIEQSYYDENDLRKRDTDLTRRFAETKAKLDAARGALAALKPVEPQQP
jgi:hypothetical protein